ncbi:hypothetical protein MCOR27_009221 [Pyricularia oryzae]|nr:hypothetical protein MCOR01_007918 [Pyricularia oryzae]KAI6270588.1 hypothetical protein MCOR27_009221 [Pyricularia oryzae]KAI6409603.1 hypothetical protein MCOR20_004926 [Pyricularia oryzae]
MPSTLTVLASGALLLTIVGSAAVPCSSPQYLVTFGDSYSQTGFNTSLAKPTASNPLGNPALPGWTSSGGLNYVGQLAGKTVGNGGAAPVLSYNFADGGATTDSAIVAPYTPTVRSFVDQVAVFEQTLGARPRPEGWADWTAEDALFGVWMGVNDVGNSHWLANATDVVDALTLRYFDGLDALYEAGGRNFYLLTVPPTERSPLMMSSNSSPTLVPMLEYYRNSISSQLAVWETSHDDADVRIVDSMPAFNIPLDDPTSYGAPDASCYGAPGTAEGGKSCLWFNDYHPAIEIHKMVAKAVADAWKGRFF